MLGPMTDGAFKGFLATLHSIQSDYSSEDLPIRTNLITARAAPAWNGYPLTAEHRAKLAFHWPIEHDS